MKAKDVRNMKTAELREKLSSLRWQLAELRLKHERRTLENPMQLGHMRKDIARILTVLNGPEGKAKS